MISPASNGYGTIVSVGNHREMADWDIGSFERRGRVMKPLSTGMVVAVVSTLALQPCFLFTAFASNPYEYYGLDDHYLDDAGDYYLDEEGERVYLTHVERTFEDGTDYVADFKYNSDKHLIYADIKKENGDWITESLTYDGGWLISVSTYSYDASSKEEVNIFNEYVEWELAHSVSKKQYPDGTDESREEWYQGQSQLIKLVTTGWA